MTYHPNKGHYYYIRQVDPDTSAAIDSQAQALGLSREEYCRRWLDWLAYNYGAALPAAVATELYEVQLARQDKPSR